MGKATERTNLMACWDFYRESEGEEAVRNRRNQEFLEERERGLSSVDRLPTQPGQKWNRRMRVASAEDRCIVEGYGSGSLQGPPFPSPLVAIGCEDGSKGEFTITGV
jgi:hypothetical protein